jgi:hypothetical protein
MVQTEEIQENPENQETNQQPAQETPKPPEVGFPLPQQKGQGKVNRWPFILIGVLVLIGGIIFLFTRGGKEEVEPSPTPVEGGLTVISSPSPTPSLAPADREKVAIEVQNGTGITGEAAYLQGQLRSLGYKDIKAGNATSQDNTVTVVSFGSSLNSLVVAEITAKHEELYQNVQTKTSSAITVDVLIVTGLKKGATAKPSASPTPTASATATPTVTPTVTPTATP